MYMSRILTSVLTIVVSLYFSCSSYAQLANLSTHLVVKDSIVSKYNRGDFSGVYDLSDTAFRKFNEEQLHRVFEKSKSVGVYRFYTANRRPW